jgi:Tol biopolymer transport system component
VHVTHATGYAGNPAWAPDGRRLLFTRSSPRGAPTRIFIVGEDGSVGQLIPEAQSPAKADYRDREPAWSWAD